MPYHNRPLGTPIWLSSIDNGYAAHHRVSAEPFLDLRALIGVVIRAVEDDLSLAIRCQVVRLPVKPQTKKLTVEGIDFLRIHRSAG
jgi:hypothetical protein